MLREVKEYWKRSAASGTAFVRKYSGDPFFRTEVHIVSLQGAFALFLLGVVGIVSSQIYHDVSAAITQVLSASMTKTASVASIGGAILHAIDDSRSRTIYYAAGAVILVTALFTYVITRLALAPTREALERQKRFIGNIAHEIRTPLSIIKTNTEVRLMDSNITEDAASLHSENLEELDRISEIINNLLSLSASMRYNRLEFRDLDLRPLIEDVVQKMRPFAQRKKLDLEVRLSEHPMVHGNSTALEQIAMNIIKNAILYTPQGGSVRVAVSSVQPHSVELVVQDNGRGIARKDLFRIFEPFYRADASRRRGAGAGGSGLGLAIVSELVKLHHGKIIVRSAEGAGTTVTVVLPSTQEKGSARVFGRAQENAQESEIAVDFSRNGR